MQNDSKMNKWNLKNGVCTGITSEFLGGEIKDV